MKDSKVDVKKERIFPRTVARFSSVQALFMMQQNALASLDLFLTYFVAKEKGCDLFADHHWYAIDEGYFSDIVKGVMAQRNTIEDCLQAALLGQRDVGALDSVTRVILLCGVWELLEKPSTPPKVVINEYVNIAKAFLPQKGYVFINGILDAVRKTQHREGEQQKVHSS